MEKGTLEKWLKLSSTPSTSAKRSSDENKDEPAKKSKISEEKVEDFQENEPK